MAKAIPDWPRMMRRTTAARYLDLTGPEFDHEVAAGKVPTPVLLGKTEHWSRASLDQWMDDLTGAGPGKGDWRRKQPAYAA